MLRLTEVRKSFGHVRAVDGLSLHVRSGQVLGLLGPNGAGKTTTISMAVGLLRPDAGTVEYTHRGQVVGSPLEARVRSLIGVAPQALALYDELTGRENLEFFGTLYGLAGAALRDRVTSVLKQVELLDRAGDRAGTYSGGMKRRLNLGAALVHEPAMLMLDEPTAGVDPQSRAAIIDLVRALKGAGHTIVYSTHYMEEAEKLCDRIAIVDHGRVLAEGTLAELLAAHGGQSVVTLVRTGEAGAAGEEERVHTSEPLNVLSGALAAGRLHSARIDAPDLEGLFLTLTGRRLRD